MTTISRFSARSDLGKLPSPISFENDVNERGEYGRTRLMLAALSNQTKSVQALVNVDDIDVNVKDLSGKTALMIASILGHVESVKVLLTARGIKVNKSNKYFDLLALGEAEDEQAIERKRNVNKSKGRLGMTALMFAAENGHSEIVDALLLDSKIDVNKTDRHNGFTALIWAVTNNQIEVVKKLLAAKGIDVNIADKFDRTPLSFAAGMSKSEIRENKVDKINEGNPELIKILLKHGAYVDKDDEELINGLFNTKIAEILRAAIRKNNILIGKMEEVVFRITGELNNDKSKGESFDEVPIDVIDRKLVQELFDDGLLKLEKSRLAKDKEIEDKIASIDKKLENLIDKNDVLYERYEIKKSSLIEKRKINKNLALNTFYLTIRSLLEARLISMILLLGGVIKRNETKGEKIAVGAAEVLAGALDAIPGGGSIGNAAVVAVREGMGKKNDKVRLEQAKRIQKYLGSPKGASKFAELVARRVTQKFDEIIVEKRITGEVAQYGGEKAAELIFDAINDNEGKTFAFDESFIKTLIEKVCAEHKTNGLFEDKKEEKKSSKALNKRVSELADEQQALGEKLDLRDKRYQGFTITSLVKPMLEQFNTKVKENFPDKANSEPLFEISMNKKCLSIILCEETQKKYLDVLNEYLRFFSKSIISDWEIFKETKSIQIEARSTQTAKELMKFFQESSLPLEIKV